MTGNETIESQDAKKRAISVAKAARYPLLVAARDIAFAIAKERGTVAVDDVRKEMEKQGLASLGPATSSIFIDDRFEFTGTFKNSTRKQDRSRRMKVWRIK
jgi:hypothetical protein